MTNNIFLIFIEQNFYNNTTYIIISNIWLTTTIINIRFIIKKKKRIKTKFIVKLQSISNNEIYVSNFKHWHYMQTNKHKIISIFSRKNCLIYRY